MPKIAIYARKSSESEDRQILSIDSQVRELKDFAVKEGMSLGAVFTESKSAKAPGRPVFNQMLKRVRKGEFAGILCWKLDRLARNPVDGGALIWAMEEHRLLSIHSPQRRFNNTGNDKFWMQLEFGMAKKYVDDLSDNVKRGLRARVATGWSSGLPPLGYLNERNTSTIIKDPDRFALVRRMWDLLLSGKYAPPDIQHIANSRWQFRTRQLPHSGGKPLSRGSIYKLFSNPYYYGAIRVNGQIYPGRHEPMISKSEFDRAQRLIHRSSGTHPSKHFFPYRGLLKCGECGGTITAEHKYNAYRKHYAYYYCYKTPDSSCTQGAIEVSILEWQIVEFLDSITITDDFRRWIVALLKELHHEESEKDAMSVLTLNRRLVACKDAMTKLLDLKLKDLVDDEDYIAKRNELENERFQIKELLDDADDHFSKVLAQCESTFDFAATARQRFMNGSDDDKKGILTLVGSQFTLKDGVLRIEPKRPLEILQSAIVATPVKNVDLQLSLGEKNSRKSGPSSARKELESESIHWRAVVYALHTFFRENPTFFNVEESLAH